VSIVYLKVNLVCYVLLRTEQVHDLDLSKKPLQAPPTNRQFVHRNIVIPHILTPLKDCCHVLLYKITQ